MLSNELTQPTSPKRP